MAIPEEAPSANSLGAGHCWPLKVCPHPNLSSREKGRVKESPEGTHGERGGGRKTPVPVALPADVYSGCL